MATDAACDFIGVAPGKRRRTSVNAPPREQLDMLRSAQQEGFDVHPILDVLLIKKIGASVDNSLIR